jgi:hypothetical protein
VVGRGAFAHTNVLTGQPSQIPLKKQKYSRSQKVVTLDFRGHILFEFVSRERLSQMKDKSNNKNQLDFDSQ